VKVVVAGAGVVGCAVAHELCRRGAHVQVLDGRDVGRGASRASAGVLAPYIEGHSEALLQLGLCSLAAYDGFVDHVCSDGRHAIEYRRTGTLEVALDDLQAERLRAMAGAGNGSQRRYLDAGEARALEPALPRTATGAVYTPSHGYVRVRELLSGLAAAITAMGGTISPDTHAVQIESVSSGVRIVTAGGAIEADAIVLAAGSWSGTVSLHATPPAPVTPIRGQLLELACRRPPASCVLWGSECYLVPWQDGTVLVGATVEDVGFDESATVAGVRSLLEAACDLLPATSDASFREVRVGLRPRTPDALPIIGRSATLPRVYYATGHYRNGVLLAPLTAVAVADQVLEGRVMAGLESTSPSRFGL